MVSAGGARALAQGSARRAVRAGRSARCWSRASTCNAALPSSSWPDRSRAGRCRGCACLSRAAAQAGSLALHRVDRELVRKARCSFERAAAVLGVDGCGVGHGCGAPVCEPARCRGLRGQHSGDSPALSAPKMDRVMTVCAAAHKYDARSLENGNCDPHRHCGADGAVSAPLCRLHAPLTDPHAFTRNSMDSVKPLPEDGSAYFAAPWAREPSAPGQARARACRVVSLTCA
jgi:hypothetical protein